MGCRNSVPVHDGESDGSTVDPDLLETTCLVCKKRKPQIAIQNNSERVLFAAVMDDINTQIVTKFKASASIGTDGVSGDAGVVWDFARVSTQQKTLLIGSRNIFFINGDCCSLWISDKNDFPVSSTPYCSMRIPKGHVQEIKGDVFSEVETTEHTKKLGDFLRKPLAECRLLDVPGIGRVSAKKLEAAGCESTTRLRDVFITTCHSRSEELAAWLTSTCGIQGHYANRAALALQRKLNANTD